MNIDKSPSGEGTILLSLQKLSCLLKFQEILDFDIFHGEHFNTHKGKFLIPPNSTILDFFQQIRYLLIFHTENNFLIFHMENKEITISRVYYALCIMHSVFRKIKYFRWRKGPICDKI